MLRVSGLRAVVLGTVMGAAGWALARAAARQAASAGPGPDGLVAVGVLGVGALAAAWLALGCAALAARAALAAVATVPAALDHVLVALTPRLLRRMVALGLGAGLAAGPLVPPALAAETPPPLGWQVTEPTTAPSVTASIAPAVSGPDQVRAAAAPSPARAPSPSSRQSPAPGPAAVDPAPQSPASGGPATLSAGPATVVVRPGDCLWSIAAAHLAPGASDADVAAAWPAWYRVNATTVGPDPDLLLPGQVLAVPADPRPVKTSETSELSEATDLSETSEAAS